MLTPTQRKNAYKARRRAAVAEERERAREDASRRVCALVVIQWWVSWIKNAWHTPFMTPRKRRKLTRLLTSQPVRAVVHRWCKVGYFLCSVRGRIDSTAVVLPVYDEEYTAVDAHGRVRRYVLSSNRELYELAGHGTGSVGQAFGVLEERTCKWQMYTHVMGRPPTVSSAREHLAYDDPRIGCVFDTANALSRDMRRSSVC